MRLLLLLAVLFLSACGTQLTLISPPIPDKYKQACPDAIAPPLTTADQFDLSTALNSAIKTYRTCAANHEALIEAVDVRSTVTDSIVKQMKGK